MLGKHNFYCLQEGGAHGKSPKLVDFAKVSVCVKQNTDIAVSADFCQFHYTIYLG